MSLVKAISSLSSSAPTRFVPGTTLNPKDVEAIPVADINDMVDRVVSQWDMSDFDIDQAARLFGYEGFDPYVIYASLLAAAQKSGISDDDLKSDIGLILVLHHVKGNITDANFKTMSAEGQNMTLQLYKRYGMTLNAKKNRKNAVTIPRVGSCFPLQMSIIAMKNTKNFMGPYDSRNLPNCMKTSSFPSLIPIGDKASKFLQLAYNAYATDQHIALTKLNYSALTADEKMNHYTNQLKFSDISFNSPIMDSDARRRAMTILDIGKYYKEIKSVYDKIGLSADSAMTEDEWKNAVKGWNFAGVSAITL